MIDSSLLGKDLMNILKTSDNFGSLYPSQQIKSFESVVLLCIPEDIGAFE